jgi:hypothetical protein
MNVSSRRPTIASRFRAPAVIFAAAWILLSWVPRPAQGHQHTAPWLDESAFDRGLYIEVRHPRVIRKPGSFDVSVVMSNLASERDVVVKEVRYLVPGAFDAVVHRRNDVLATKRASYRQYKRTQRQLQESARRRDRAATERLNRRSQDLLVNITAGTFRDRQRIPVSVVPQVGSTIDIMVEIDVIQARRRRTLRRPVVIAVQPPLPTGAGGSWFAGDQHLHTAYSIDAFFLEGNADIVTDFAMTAQTVGLDWIIITDHTNLNFLFWYQPYLFSAGESMAQTFRNTNDYLVLQGQEMGIGAQGFFGEAAHLLVYPYTVDSTGFLPNPCPGLLFNHVNCEPEQVILDRVNDNGGIGFIAHPFDSVPLFYAKWNLESDAVGWAGLEIFNSDLAVFSPEDEQSIGWWHDLLNQIDPPQNGQLAVRPDYPTRFPVGLGNSDAHQPGRIGNTFTYANLPGVARGFGMVPREDVMDAFVKGRCVASNGPLVFGEIEGAGTGEVAILPPGQNQLAVTLQTTPEFGPVGDYQVTVLVNGSQRAVIPPSGSPDFQTTIVLQDLLSPPDKFVTLRAERTNCPSCPPGGVVYHAIANPIWLEFSAPIEATDGK